eukprot:Awhi_evm1s14079
MSLSYRSFHGLKQVLLLIVLIIYTVVHKVNANGGWESRSIITNWNCDNEQGIDVEVYGTDPFTGSEFLLKKFEKDVGTSAKSIDTELEIPKQFLPLRLQFVVDDSGTHTNRFGTPIEAGTILDNFERRYTTLNNGVGIWCKADSSYHTNDVSVGGHTHNYGIKDATCSGGIQVWGASGRYYGKDYPNGSGNSYATYVPEYDFPVTVCKVDVPSVCMQLGKGGHGGGYQIWCLGSRWWR